MADRNLESGRNFAKGLVFLDFSFLANGVSSPVTTSFRGGAEAVATVTRESTGQYLVTMRDKWRYCAAVSADMTDLHAADDGAYATAGAPQNEGSSTLPVSFRVYTRTAGGVKTDYTGRRVNVKVVFKNSTVGV